MLNRFSAMFHSASKQRSQYSRDQKINLSSFADVDDEFTVVNQFLSESLPLVIELPFQGTWLKALKGGRNIVFVSREGRLAVLDTREQVVVRDETVSASQIWTLDVDPSEKFVYLAGQDPVIRKYALDSLTLEKEFQGHRDEVNRIIIGLNNEWMLSASDDQDIRLWSFTEKFTDKVLYSHQSVVYALDLSENNVFLASGSGDHTAVIYELQWDDTGECGKILTTLSADSPIWAVKISPTNKFVVTGDQMGHATIFNFHDWVKLRVFKERQRIRSIDISKDEKTMITAGQEGPIFIWHLDRERKHLELREHTAMVKAAKISENQNFIVSLADDRKVIRWRIPTFEDKNLMEHNPEVITLWGSEGQIGGLCQDKLILWNLEGKCLKSAEIREFLYFHITPDNTLFLISKVGESKGKTKFLVSEYELVNLTLVKENKFSVVQIISISVSQDKKYLFIGETYKINTFLIQENMKLYNSQIYHDDDVIKLCATPDGQFLFSAGKENKIKMLDIIKMGDTSQRNQIADITDISQPVIDLACTKDNSKLIAISETSLLVWSITQQATLKFVNLNVPVTKILLSKVGGFFFLQNSDSIEVWTFHDFNFKSRLEFHELHLFVFDSSEQFIAIKHGKTLECFESPLSSKVVKIIGCHVQEKLGVFLAYVKKIMNGSSKRYRDEFKDWLIMPFMFSIQHIYAFYNYDDYLNYSFLPGIDIPLVDTKSIGDAPYIKSANGYTPLSISLYQQYDESSKSIIKAMKKRWLAGDPFSLVYFTDSITELNNSGLDGLQKLYSFALRPSFLSNLPAFCEDASLPIVLYSENMEINPGIMLGADANTSDGVALSFEQTCFRVNMNLGSKKGIQFMESIVKCKNELIFGTPLIQLILEEKWKRARLIMYIQSALYLAYMVSLSYYSTDALGDGEFLILPAVMNCGLLIYEIFQMYAAGLDYFKDVWNYVDLIRSILFFIYAGFVWKEYLNTEPEFLTMIILITWIRGVTYFRIFSPTRYLINLLFEVFMDIPAFLAIFFYAIFAFSFIFYTLLYPNPGTYYVTLLNTYSTTLGNSSTDGLNELQWLFYLLITLFNFIIMLNLLISILSDTYARVKDNQIVADGQELASMILEVEMMLFWNSGNNETQFVHVCRDQAEGGNSSDVQMIGKFKGMNQKCMAYDDQIQQGLEILEGFRDKVLTENKEYDDLLKEISNQNRL